MKRQDIMGKMPELEDENKVEEFTDWMKDVLDGFEFDFGEINDKLNIETVDDLANVSEAKDIADQRTRDLY